MHKHTDTTYSHCLPGMRCDGLNRGNTASVTLASAHWQNMCDEVTKSGQWKSHLPLLNIHLLYTLIDVLKVYQAKIHRTLTDAVRR